MTTFDTSHNIRLEQDGRSRHDHIGPEHTSMKMIKEMGKPFSTILEDNSEASIIVLKGQDGRFNLGLDFKEFTLVNHWISMDFTNGKRCVRLERMPLVHLTPQWKHRCWWRFSWLCAQIYESLHPSTTFPEFTRSQNGISTGYGHLSIAKNIGLGTSQSNGYYNLLESLQLKLCNGVSINDVSEDSPLSDLKHTSKPVQPVNPVAIQLARRLLNESFHDAFEDAIGHFLAAQQRAISHDQFLKTVDKHSKFVMSSQRQESIATLRTQCEVFKRIRPMCEPMFDVLPSYTIARWANHCGHNWDNDFCGKSIAECYTP